MQDPLQKRIKEPQVCILCNARKKMEKFHTDENFNDQIREVKFDLDLRKIMEVLVLVL